MIRLVRHVQAYQAAASQTDSIRYADSTLAAAHVVLQHDPSNTTALVLSAKLRKARGDSAGAVQALRKINWLGGKTGDLSHGPGLSYVPAWIDTRDALRAMREKGLLRHLSLSGEQLPTLFALARSVQDWPGMIAAGSAWLRTDSTDHPMDAWSCLDLIMAYELVRQPAQGARVVARCVAKSAPSGRFAWTEIRNQWRVKSQRDDDTAVVRIRRATLQALLRQHPHDPVLLHAAFIIAGQERDWPRVVATGRALGEVAPDATDAWYFATMVEAYCALGQPELAVAARQRFLTAFAPAGRPVSAAYVAELEEERDRSPAAFLLLTVLQRRHPRDLRLQYLRTTFFSRPPSSLKTRWAALVSPEHVLPEYPRPQLVRPRWLNLNGRWEYAIRDSAAAPPDRYDGTILVPFPVESQLSAVRRPVTPAQRLWYRRTFRAPHLAPGERLLLHFGAVDWDASVRVNGHEVGRHRGGYDPFTFDITDALRAAPMQEIVVRVWDPTTEGAQPRGKQSLQASGIAYTAVTGIWQTVWLEPVPRASVRALSITPDVNGGTVRVCVSTAGAHPTDRVRAIALDGAHAVGAATGHPGDTLTIRVPRARLWSPDHPFLYTLRVSLTGGDRVESYFGMRTIAVARDSAGINRLFLNGKPLFELGLLDQGWWPDGLYTAPTDAALRYDIETAKRLGFNLLRKHVKVEPARWYYDADRLGILVWQDMPSGDNTTPQAQDEFADEFRRMVDALRNHPAIVMWVAFNEGWGQHDVLRYVHWLKAYDPTRLVNNAAGILESKWRFQPGEDTAGDVADLHKYPGPEMPPLEPRRAAVLGEFGGLGLEVPGHRWFEQGSFSYAMNNTSRDLGRAYRTLIRHLRTLQAEGLSAAVYTQVSDVEGEVNGLLTYDRAVVKLPADAARENATLFGAPAAPSPRPASKR